jgi:hypothetical protein
MQICRTTLRDADARLARTAGVQRLAAVVAFILVATATASAPAATTRAVTVHGLRIELPPGWRVSKWVWSSCDDPSQTLALVTGKHPVREGGLLLVLEDTVNPVRAFHPRSTFRLPPKASTFEGCCGTPAGAGYQFILRQHGRDFEVFLWARDRGLAKAAVAALNTLRVAER